MNKQMPFSKGVFCLVVVILVSLLLVARTPQPQIVEAADESSAETGQVCSTQRVSTFADNTMPVPSACLDGLCKLVLYLNSYMGAFDDGYSWEVYYYQWSSVGAWVGGPNMAMGGVEFSDGVGQNGDGHHEAVFGGGSSGNGYIRIMDDGPNENDPNLWSIESRGDEQLTSATLTACSVPGMVSTGLITSHQSIDVPEFCIDSLCMIFRWSFDSFGDTNPGLSNPVFYLQDSVTDLWIAGPNITYGIYYSDGAGENGDGAGMTTIFGGGYTELGGKAELLDDGAEWSNSQWSVYYDETDDMTGVYYWFAPMTCVEHHISPGVTYIDTPEYCVDSLCTIVRWTDAWFDPYGPGFLWPVSYRQDSSDGSWIGGPNVIFGGVQYSHGSGTNGDTNTELIYDGGINPPGGYVYLVDDSSMNSETEDDQWIAWLDNFAGDVTSATYHICSNTCEETILMINKEFLPFVEH